MPQLEIVNFSSQIFWLIICVLTLFFSLKKVFLPRILYVKKNRAEKIKNLYSEAKKMLQEAEMIKNEFDSKIKDAYIEASKIHGLKIAEFENGCSKKLQKIQEEHSIAIRNSKSKMEEERQKYRKFVPDESNKLFGIFNNKISLFINDNKDIKK